jgi:hypothetical protein
MYSTAVNITESNNIEIEGTANSSKDSEIMTRDNKVKLHDAYINQNRTSMKLPKEHQILRTVLNMGQVRLPCINLE